MFTTNIVKKKMYITYVQSQIKECDYFPETKIYNNQLLFSDAQNRIKKTYLQLNY